MERECLANQAAIPIRDSPAGVGRAKRVRKPQGFGGMALLQRADDALLAVEILIQRTDANPGYGRYVICSEFARRVDIQNASRCLQNGIDDCTRPVLLRHFLEHRSSSP